MDLGGIPNMANHGPIGEERNGILIWLVYVCLGCLGWLIATFVWMKKTLEEVKAFTQNDGLLAPILFFVPYVNIFMIWQYSNALKETQQKIGMPEEDQINPIMAAILCLVLFFGIVVFQNNVNKTWEFAKSKGGGGAPPPPA